MRPRPDLWRKTKAEASLFHWERVSTIAFCSSRGSKPVLVPQLGPCYGATKLIPLAHDTGSAMRSREIIVKDTHRGLWYQDGVLVKVLEAGRHVIPSRIDLGFWRTPLVEVALVDMR